MQHRAGNDRRRAKRSRQTRNDHPHRRQGFQGSRMVFGRVGTNRPNARNRHLIGAQRTGIRNGRHSGLNGFLGVHVRRSLTDLPDGFAQTIAEACSGQPRRITGRNSQGSNQETRACPGLNIDRQQKPDIQPTRTAEQEGFGHIRYLKRYLEEDRLSVSAAPDLPFRAGT